MLRKLLPFLLALWPGLAHAQIAGPPFVFVPFTVVDADEVNLNFATVYSAACNRTGCTMTGPLLFSADNTVDVGANGTTRPRDLWLGRNASIIGTLTVGGVSTLTGAVTLAGALTLNNTATITSTTSPQLNVRYDGSNRATLSIANNGASTWDVFGAGASTTFLDPVTTSSTFTAAGAAGVTGSDGFRITNTAPALWINETGGPANEGKWFLRADASNIGLYAVNDLETIANVGWSVLRSAGVPTAFEVTPQFRAGTGTAAAPSISFIADPDTGIYNAPNQIIFSTGATTRAQISSTGFNSLVDLLAPRVLLTDTIFAALGAPTDGTLIFCSDCTVANPCAAAGTGALAKRLAGAWRCN